ncbi:MAG TPA: type II secretion system protein GspL [Candidatus Saccharimonadia bacterium]|nr:type II secretion system protein GspL [Candidatus Saccharimonadia bacterium]
MPKHVLGIALDTASITLVRLTGSMKSYDVTLATQHLLPQHDEPQEQAALQRQALHTLLDPLRLHGDTILVALPAHNAVLRNLTFPFKEPRRIYQILKNSLDEHMPFEPEEVVADFYPLPSPNTSEARLLVAGMPEEVIATSLDLLQDIGLDPAVLDLDVFGLANAALLGCTALPARTVLVDVNAERTLLTLLDRETPVLVRSLAYRFPEEAEALASYAGRLSKHLQQTYYACEHVLQQPYEPDLLLVSGVRGDQASILAKELQEVDGIPAEVWRVTAGAYKADQTRLPAPDLVRYAVAFGMALRGLHRRACGVNLRRERFALHKDLEELRGRLIVFGILAVGVIGLGIASLYLNTSYKAQRYAQLQDEITHVFRATLPEARMVQPTVQLREKIRELEERLKAFGGMTGAQLSGLQILHEISARTPPSITLNVDTLTITTGTTDLGGSTESYDDVVKLKSALEASPFFPTVKITNTKTDVGNKISFKLTINTSKTPGGNL